MAYDPQQHHRRSIRLPGFDYTQDGLYFVTLVTHERECLFDDPIFRTVAETHWQQIPKHSPFVHLDAWVVMPNHLHGILILSDNPEERTGRSSSKLAPGSLGAIVGSYKSLTTRRLNHMAGLEGRTVWQRNYYERIIRSEPELTAIRKYIEQNPANWALDEHHPRAAT